MVLFVVANFLQFHTLFMSVLYTHACSVPSHNLGGGNVGIGK